MTSLSNSWTYDGSAHTYHTYTVHYGDETIEGTEDQTEFTLSTGDKLTVTPANTATITHVEETTVDNAFTWTVENEDFYTKGTDAVGKLSVTTATLAIVTGSDSKEYDGTALTADGTATFGETTTPLTAGTPVEVALAGGETIHVTVTGSQTEVGNSDNTYAIAWGEVASTDYNVVSPTIGKLTVTKSTKELIVVSADGEWPYDGSAHSAVSYTVTYDGEEVTVVDETETGKVFTLPTGDKLTISNPASITNVSQTADHNNTYSYSLANSTQYGENIVTAQYGKLTITPKSVTLKSGGKTREYNGTALTNLEVESTNAHGLTVETGWVDGEGASYDFTGSQLNVGKCTNTFTYTLNNNTLASNYNIAKTEDTLRVTANTTAIAVSPKDSSKVYDGIALTATDHDDFTVTGVPDGFTWTAEADGTVTNVVPGTGEKAANAVTVFKIWKGATDVTDQFSNITIGNPRTLTITQRPISVSVPDSTVRYDGTEKCGYGQDKCQFPNLVYGHTATITYNPSCGIDFADDPYETGYYINSTLHVKDALDHNVTSNYTLTATTVGKLQINPPPVKVIADTLSKTYDGIALKATYTVEAIGVTPTIKYKKKIGEDWSDYITNVIDTPSITNAGTLIYMVEASANNYTVSDTGMLTITPKAISIAANDTSKVYGDEDPELTVTVTGKPEHGVDPVCHLSRAEGENAGDYAITLTVANPNYTITPSNGIFRIKKRSVTVSVPDTVEQYTGAQHTGKTEYTFNNVLGNQTATIDYTEAKGRLVGVYYGKYDTASFKVMMGNFDVTSNYSLDILKPGKMTITKRSEPYEITVVAKSDSVMYDRDEHSAEGFVNTVFHVAGHHFTVSGLETSDPISTDVCNLSNTISGTAVVKDDSNNVVTDQFIVHTVNGKLQIVPRTVTLKSNFAVKMYDGTPLTANAQSDVQPVDLGFAPDEGATYNITGSQTLVGSSDNTFTYTLNEGTKASNYIITTEFRTLTVTSDTTNIHIKSLSDEFYYDGSPHTYERYEVNYGTQVFTATQGDDGKYYVKLNANDTLFITPDFPGITHVKDNLAGNNRFTYSLQNSDQFSGQITTSFGTVRIDSIPVHVHVVGKQRFETYNGQEYTITGYDAHFSSDLYDKSFFEFHGDSIASRTEAGIDTMDMLPSHFINTNRDFYPVTFEVNKGRVVIAPIDTVIVGISGNHETNNYDGAEHSVEGYVVTGISNPTLYHQSDITFTGTALASRTVAGRTWMGLTPSMFGNSNPNVDTVIFYVTDGFQHINYGYATVEISGHHSVDTFDATSHTIKGYDVVSNNAHYTKGHFTFNGDSTATRTFKGVTKMGLRPEHFVNQDTNFNSVRFVVVEDGFQEILPADTSKIDLVCPGVVEKKYDGSELNPEATASSLIPADNFTHFKIEYKTMNGDWTTTPPSITDHGALSVEVRCTDTNYVTKYCRYDLLIHKREVVLTSADSTRMYNGDWLVFDSVRVTGDGFVTGEGASFDVTGKQLLPGPSENTFTYTLNEGTKAINYDISTYFGTLRVTERPQSQLYPITVVAKSNTVEYDGYKHTVSGFDTLRFTTVDNHVYTVEGFEAEVSAYDVGGHENAIQNDPVVRDEYGNLVTDQFAVTPVNGTLTITPRYVTITVPNEQYNRKVYDGDSLRVDYPNIYVSNLADRDTLTAGYIISEGYEVGTYNCHDGGFMAMLDGVASKHHFNITHGALEGEYEAGSSLSNYSPTFNVSLEITERPLKISADSAEKVYDGEPLTLTAKDFTLTGEIPLAHTDSVIITHSGKQTCVGESANEITSVTVMHKADWVNVTSSYDISTVNGLLTVIAETNGFTCPDTLKITLIEDTYDTIVPQSQLGMATHSLVNADVATVDNNLSAHNPLVAGTHTITWTLYDTCQTAMTTCEQIVEVDYTPCVGVDDYDGHTYDAERIGFQCWLTENLRSESNAEGNTIANYHAFMDNPDNLSKFGYLYSWYSAMNVAENDDSAVPVNSIGDNGRPYVQGICPNGWAVGSLRDFAALYLTAGDATLLKDAGDGYWIPGNGGSTPNSGFDARANGRFNSTTQRYEDLLTGSHFWMPESVTTAGTHNSTVIQYYCNEGLFQQHPKTDLRGVRCIRKVAP